jgi:hypothetical protein
MDTAKFATEIIVDTFPCPVSSSAATRRYSNQSAAIPRSNLVAHSHVLMSTASACRVHSASQSQVHAARLGNLSPQSAIPNHYKLNSKLSNIHVGNSPIFLLTILYG